MAKQKRSGLGRGLNSLLGESLGEINQKDADQQQTTADEAAVSVPDNTQEKPSSAVAANNHVVQRAETEISEEAVASATIKERTTPSKSVHSAREVAAEQAVQRAVIKGEEAPVRPYIEEDDHVTIKGVAVRETSRPPVKEPSSEEVPLDTVKPNPDQPRTHFDVEEIAELAQSIEKEGLLQPILVRKVDDGYQIIAGERRWQACKKLGMKTVPIRVKDVEGDKALELALIENIQRSDLNPIEEAYGYKRLMERQGLTQSEVARAVSKGRSTIANALRLLELPEDAQQLLFEEKITAGHARAILSIPTTEGRQKLVRKLQEEKLSVRETESLARLFAGQLQTNKESVKRTPLPTSFKRVARGLRENLEADVRVRSVKGKNKIEISFKDEADLQRLFNKIVSE
ncbi:ParB-like partition protein [Cryptobacterium curtum DSM 15641]|uniref:ParB-like partition protein n=1 Tax=Cryptobacterium curtum (strain ATCC 700683 / DSM 15641 / CCUG 43107 / 12-3) TaxID=469378 RepID=C7MLX0_CRYCD|nr:ParB/RepB/Spo0J family partition protein [Cryptobacterium curtum]ACU95086.1 ParB-like partition protein [Cryptobacterium curtum DSM 15641]